MGLIEFHQFKSNSLSIVDVQTTGGPVYIASDETKRIQGSGITLGELGFYKRSPVKAIENRIWQWNFYLPSEAVSVVAIGGLSKTQGLQSSGAAMIAFNSFPTPTIKLHDSNESGVSGGTPLTAIDFNEWYTAKLQVNADGTSTAYLTGGGNTNHNLGTTVLITDFINSDLYWSGQQTFIGNSSYSTRWDNLYIHDDGLIYNAGNFMSYCDHDDIKAEFKSLTYAADTGDGITQAEVTEWCDQESAVIDAKIANRYSTPIAAASESLKVLKKICIGLVASRLIPKLKYGTEDFEKAQTLMKNAYEMLKELSEGKASLTDATKSTGRPIFRSYAKTNTLDPLAKRDTKQW